MTRVTHTIQEVAAVVAVFLGAVVLVVTGTEPAEGQSPPPIYGQYRVNHVFLNQDSSEVKGGSAMCEPGDWVLGGGARAFGDSPAVDQLLALGEMQPVGAPRPGDGRHGFTAYAQEVRPGTSSDWVLSVFAVCAAEKPPGHQIVAGPRTAHNSSSSKEARADCGSGRVALGAGARIEHLVGEPDPLGASLTVVRPTGSGASTVAGGKEWFGGYSGGWRLRSYAVCAEAPQGYQIRHTDTTGKTARATCTGEREFLGTGAVADIAIAGSVPRHRPEGADAFAPNNQDSAFIAAYVTCAYTAPPPPTPPPTPPPCPPELPNCQEP